jgi:ParB family chromosome partitioning protein
MDCNRARLHPRGGRYDSNRFTSLRDPSAAITWACELTDVSKNSSPPSVLAAVVKQVNQKRITNSKDLRKLRAILPDPVARAHFLNDEGDYSAALCLTPLGKKPGTACTGDLEAAVEAMKNVTWTALEELKGDRDILKKIADAIALLQSLRKALS